MLLEYGHSNRRTNQKSVISFGGILNILRFSPIEARKTSELHQEFQINEFNLGEELINHQGAETVQPDIENEQHKSVLYVICKGRIRLLNFDRKQQREVSVAVLEAGETFGADDWLYSNTLPYRAIAASVVEVACLPIAQLQLYIENIPALGDRLRQEVRQRQDLIFLKSCTELRCLPSHQLQQILPYLTQIEIAAGELLTQSSPASEGRYWLRSGQINQPEMTANQPSALGASWGYPESTPEGWKAQTNLLVYKLPQANWTEVEMLAPGLADVFSQQVNGDTGVQPQLKFSKAVTSRVSAQPVVVSTPSQPSQEKATTASASQPEINFPTPIGRRILNFWDRYPFIQQQSSSDCGVACLAMISQYWGKRFSLNVLRNLAEVGLEGASLKSLAKASESLGFHARPVRASLNKLTEQRNPWVAHWQGNHYIVVYRVKGDRIFLADPAVGRRVVSRQEFLSGWTGYALLLAPTNKFQAIESDKISLNQFTGALSPYQTLIWQIVAASIIIQIFGIITPLFTQIILDQVVVNKSFTTLNVFALGLVLFGIWSIGLTAVRQYLLDYFSNRFDLTLISGFISHTLLLPLKFFESRRVGDIITRVQENQKIQQFLTRQVILTWLDMLTGVVYLGLMAYYNWSLTLLVLALIPLIAILTAIATPLLRRISREVFNEAASQNSLLVEMITGVNTIKATAAEREMRWRWEDSFTSFLNANFRSQKLANILQASGSLINTLGSTALLWYGATLVIQDQLSIGQFVAFNMMIGKVINPVLEVVNLWDQMQEVLISVERLNDVFQAQPEESPGKPMLVLPRLKGEVRFENVTFRYSEEQERNTLQNITLEAQPGQTIAIVGRSGSGKTTLISLLQGLYQPDSGRILYDGYDIRHVSPQSLRSQLGVVPQECFLFSGTILENITLFRSEFNLEQATEVAKLAEAHAFIQDMPLGYNTKVGERGTMLSGGQRQRLAIARALLGEPRILVLDEATSSLDTESERRFQQNLERLSRHRTTFIIAHRLSTVRNADCILVLDKGILVERGTHTELMDQQGLYYQLAQQQLNL